MTEDIPTSDSAERPDPPSADVQGLLEQSSGWLGTAMESWSNDQPDKVAALAPLAVELALKALLWHRSPALLVPLDQRYEQSLVALATAPDLTDPKLRTVGLTEALRRAFLVVGTEPPVGKGRRERLLACRNGAVHLGGFDAQAGRHVLTDSIAILTWVVDNIGVPRGPFFGDNAEDCAALLEAGRSEIAESVLKRIARSRRRFESLRAAVADDAAESLLNTLEASSMLAHFPMDEDVEMVPAERKCPACKRLGALYGLVEIDGDADVEWDDGELIAHGFWIITLTPEYFHCDVCRLRLFSPQELEAAGLPHKPYEPQASEMGEFDPADYAGHGDYDTY